ncbi:Response regulator PleD [Caloramator mitchellensis]|uniref:Stage 0 sporulation protein A homolog n=1 Tax=Caloramator mitchellensis TaxID=908809 RepID=A0A0R3JWP8_CALMK|nr:diguanylate cyclase [Caloramator mitchellensis]KRQ87977.1 Response regulator PleD [Caloramator mitchellensis]
MILPHILVIEDSLLHGKMIQDVLQKNNYSVKWVISAEDALDEDLDKYDLVLTDLILPGITGYELSEKIKSKNPYLPIIAITSVTEDESISKALSLGADDYIKKPFSVIELIARINVQLRTRHFQLELIKKNKELEEANKKIKELAVTDMLTGAFNRVYLREFLTNIAKENLFKKVSCFIIDLDNFKKINDTYGHLMGDIVLKNLVTICKNIIMNKGIVVRFGGEEFLGIIIDDKANAYDIAEKIRIEVENNKNCEFRWTISIGLSSGILTSKNVYEDFEIILKEADEMLYVSKKNGKNRVTKK